MRWLFALVLGLLCQFAAVAQADSVDEAARLKAEGDALMGDIKYEAALGRYDQAYELNRDPALLYNQGRALEALGRYPEAYEKLSSFAKEAPAELKARVPRLDKLIDEVAGRTTILSLDVSPSNANVVLGTTVLGRGSIAGRRVNAGKAIKLRVSGDGFDEDVRDLDLPGGGKLTLRVELIAKDKSGILVVRSEAAGATIRIGAGEPRQLPTEMRVPAGSHVVTMTAPDHEQTTVEVVVLVGERKELVIDPADSPVYERWWFWTIGGTLLAGGAAAGITYAALSEGSPDEGSIQPCQLTIAINDDGTCERSTTASRFGGSASTWNSAGRSVGPSFSIGPVPVFSLSF